MADLDPRFTFEYFVVGPANRLASAAARRAAENPGSGYNPLFIYAASGLGKTHILGGIAHHVARIHPEKSVEYQTLEEFLGELAEALSGGEERGAGSRYQSLDILLLDDVQFLTDQAEAQEMLLRTLDTLTGEGKQVVLASDRPPAEINGLDSRLRSRFESGLLVDMGPPEYETRVAIVRKKAQVRGQALDQRVAEVIGRIGFSNVRELGGALNRILAAQELEGRVVTPNEVLALLGQEKKLEPDQFGSELGAFLEELSRTVAAKVEAQETPWRKLLRETAEEVEKEGFKARRLRRFLTMENPPGDVERVVQEFRATVKRLRAIKQALDAVGNPWPEAAFGVLRDPERIEEAEALLASARERARSFPRIPDTVGLSVLKDEFPQLVLRAAEQLITSDRPEYNPLYVWSPGGSAARVLVQAAALTNEREREGGSTALVSVAGFAEEFIEALSQGVAGAWRERWWSADLLAVYGAEDLSQTERAQEEFFHLFEALQRRRARILVASDRPPSEIPNIDERLRSRFEGGLVLEIPIKEGDLPASFSVPSQGPRTVAAPPRPPPRRAESETSPEPAGRGGKDVSELDRAWISSFRPQSGGGAVGPTLAMSRMTVEERKASGKADGSSGGSPEGVPWLPSRELTVWKWPRLEDRIVEDPD